MTDKKIILGTRGSKLALWQTTYVRDLLAQRAVDYDFEIRIIRTKGDKILNVALSKIGDKGLFTKELERALLAHEVDLCIHSMKDMPTELPAGLALLGVPRRANPCDALIGATGMTLATLPVGARVATGSLRRRAQLHRIRPDIELCEMRGNIDTRIGRVVAGEFDAAVLAAAGLARLGLDNHIAQTIPTEVLIPAAAQGAIAIEARQDDEVARELCDLITDQTTLRSVRAERSVLRELEGGCQVPFGAYSHTSGTGKEALFSMTAFVSSLDGVRFLRAQDQGRPEDADLVARRITADLLDQGAKEILKELR